WCRAPRRERRPCGRFVSRRFASGRHRIAVALRRGIACSMLDPAYVRDHPADVDVRLRSRGLDPSRELSDLAALEADRRRLIPLVENLKRDQNAAGEAVARAKKEGRDAAPILAENKARAAEIREHEASLAEVERRRD